jgi:hypothetical protein
MLSKPNYPSVSSYIDASQTLNVSINVIKSFAKIESGTYGAFLPYEPYEPVILYERHIFHRLTKGKYDKEFVEIRDSEDKNNNHPIRYSLSSFSTGGYGPVSVQHAKLAAACKLDRTSALMSCSWGLFQLMGENYLLCGHLTLQSFINAMYNSVDDHLAAFCQFVLNNKKRVEGKLLIEALRSTPPDYEVASLIYNGPKAIKNGYHIKFRKAYEGLIK